jgi:segregation and condensation protein B
LDSNLPPGFTIPEPNDSVLLTPDEDPLDGNEEEEEEDTSENTEQEVPLLEEDEKPEGEAVFPTSFPFPLLRRGQV